MTDTGNYRQVLDYPNAVAKADLEPLDVGLAFYLLAVAEFAKFGDRSVEDIEGGQS